MLQLGWPQIIVLMLSGMALGLDMAHHGKEKRRVGNAWMGIAAVAIHHALLYWGGWYSQ